MYAVDHDTVPLTGFSFQMKLNQNIQSITRFYYKMSNFGKVLLFITILLILMVCFKSIIPSSSSSSFFKGKGKEGFVSNENFLFKKGNDIYDDFYSEIYVWAQHLGFRIM